MLHFSYLHLATPGCVTDCLAMSSMLSHLLCLLSSYKSKFLGRFFIATGTPTLRSFGEAFQDQFVNFPELPLASMNPSTACPGCRCKRTRLCRLFFCLLCHLAMARPCSGHIMLLNFFATASMKGSVLRYESGDTLVVPWTQIARSLVYSPPSIVAIVAFSRVLQ
jgi:hypothetical protein